MRISVRPMMWCGAVLFVLSPWSCSGPAKTAAQADRADKPVAVAAVKVARKDLIRSMVLAAEFRPYQEIEVHAKVAGYLKQISVDVGDRVRAGQVLATLEIPEMQDEAVQAAASKKRSEADVTRMRTELERAESAHEASHLSYRRLAAVLNSKPGLVAQQEIDDAQARDRMAEAQVAAARAAIVAGEQQVAVAESGAERIRTMQTYQKITAPFAGVITKRYADLGAMIQAGTASQSQAMPVVRLSQNDRLRLILPVPESAVSQIHIGTPVEVRVQTMGKTFTGLVARFAARVNANTRTMETEVDVANPSLELVPGMYADGVITLERKLRTLAVPIQAVSGTGGRFSVMLANASGHLEARPVRVGMETPDEVEIVDGLSEGDLVVIGKQGQLHPGQPVEPKLNGGGAK